MTRDTVKSRGERRTTKSNAHHLTQQEISCERKPLCFRYCTLSTLVSTRGPLSALTALINP